MLKILILLSSIIYTVLCGAMLAVHEIAPSCTATATCHDLGIDQ